MTKAELKEFIANAEGLEDDIEIQFPDGRAVRIEYRWDYKSGSSAVLVVLPVE